MKQKHLITFILLVMTLMCYTITVYAEVLEQGKEVIAEGYDQICQNLKDTTDAKARENIKETLFNLACTLPVVNAFNCGKECIETINDDTKTTGDKLAGCAITYGKTLFNNVPVISQACYSYIGAKNNEEIQTEYGGYLDAVDDAVNEYAEMGYGAVEDVKNDMSWGMTLSPTDKLTVTSESLGDKAVHSNAVQAINDYAASCDLVAGYTDSVAIQQSSAAAATDGTGQTSSNDNYIIYIVIAIIALIVILLLMKLFNKPRQPIVIQDTMPPPAPAGRSLAERM